MIHDYTAKVVGITPQRCEVARAPTPKVAPGQMQPGAGAGRKEIGSVNEQHLHDEANGVDYFYKYPLVAYVKKDLLLV